MSVLIFLSTPEVLRCMRWRNLFPRRPEAGSATATPS